MYNKLLLCINTNIEFTKYYLHKFHILSGTFPRFTHALSVQSSPVILSLMGVERLGSLSKYFCHRRLVELFRHVTITLLQFHSCVVYNVWSTFPFPHDFLLVRQNDPMSHSVYFSTTVFLVPYRSVSPSEKIRVVKSS